MRPRLLLVPFRRLARQSPGLLVVAGASAVLQSALLIPIALLVRHIFDTEIPRRHVDSIVWSGIVILALYAVAALLAYVTRAAAIWTAARVATGLRLDLLVKLQALPQRWHDRHRLAALHSITTQDSERIETMFAAVAGALVPALLVGAVLIVVAVLISPVLALTELAVVPPLMFAGVRAARRLRAAAWEWSKASRQFSTFSQLLLRALMTTRVLGAQATALERGADDAFKLSTATRQLGQAGAAVAAIEGGIAAAAGAAVLVVGGIAVAHHSITLGDLLAFYAVLGLLLRQVYSLGAQANSVIIGFQSLRDIDALLAIDEAEPYPNGRRTLAFRGGVDLSGVSFSYEENPVLRQLTLRLDAGERVAVIGPNGAGKSSLVSLMLALYEPDSGSLHADGVPYHALDIQALRRQIGVVLQDPVLLPGTIRENIAFGRREASDAAIRAAAQAATAADFIEDLPAGYETPVGDEGTGLSGGQRQRIAVARALLGAPALMVLDEPTTYLDDTSVGRLMNRLMSLPQAPTVLLVTHDPQVAVHVERVIELREGRIVADSRAPARVSAAPV